MYYVRKCPCGDADCENMSVFEELDSEVFQITCGIMGSRAHAICDLLNFADRFKYFAVGLHGFESPEELGQHIQAVLQEGHTIVSNIQDGGTLQ
jgi:hypothetical protein